MVESNKVQPIATVGLAKPVDDPPKQDVVQADPPAEPELAHEPLPEGFREFPKHIYSKRTGAGLVVHSKEEEEHHMTVPPQAVKK